MFVHLGEDIVVLKGDIIMIIDSKTKTAKDFVKILRQNYLIRNLAREGKERSYVVTEKEIFISPISSNTLKRRTETLFGATQDL